MKTSIHTITSIILDGGYYAVLPSIGPSMFPVIRSGDRVYIESLNGRIPSIGDIILFKYENKKTPSPQSSSHSGEEVIMICHRLVKILDKDSTAYYQTRGDAFFHKDTPITYDQIIGRVVKVERSVVSLPRKILLILNPFLGKFTILNASIIALLVWIKRALVKNNHLFIGYF